MSSSTGKKFHHALALAEIAILFVVADTDDDTQKTKPRTVMARKAPNAASDDIRRDRKPGTRCSTVLRRSPS